MHRSDFNASRRQLYAQLRSYSIQQLKQSAFISVDVDTVAASSVTWFISGSLCYGQNSCRSIADSRAGGSTPRTPRSGGGASRMLSGLMLRRRAVLGTPKCEKSVGRRGLCCPPPQEPHLQCCHCACPVCMYTRV